MSVNLVSTPDRYALTKSGRMLYRFEGSGRQATTGVKATNGLLLYQPIPHDTKVILSWGGQKHTLTAKLIPLNPGEIPAGDGDSAHADALLNALKSYYPIRQDFFVSRPAFQILPTVSLVARRPGAAYNVTSILPPPIPLGPAPTQPIDITHELGEDPVVRDRYGVYLEVYLQIPGTDGADRDAHYQLVGTPNHIECDENGHCEFDVGDLLHAYLMSEVAADLPSFSTATPTVATTTHRKYWVAYGEAWGQPLQPGQIVEDEIRHAYLGGVDFVHQAGAGFRLDSFGLGSSAAADRALRFGASLMATRLDEARFLSFVNLREQTDTAKLAVTLTFDDNSTAVATGLPAALPYAPGAKVIFPVGIPQLGLLNQVPAGKLLKEYSVRLQGASAPLSRAYRYVVDYDHRPFKRYFTYLSSLGSFDSLTTWGKGSRELTLFYDQAERPLLTGYQPTGAQFLDYNLSRQQQFEVASGWQSTLELDRWDDFYTSPLRFLIDPKKVGPGRALAITVSSKSIRQAKDGDTQFAHLFSYAFQHRDEFYTDDETPAGSEALPALVVPAGAVTVLPAVAVLTKDPTIDDAVRNLTKANVDAFIVAASRPNPEGRYLTHATGAEVFRSKAQPIDFNTDLVNVPDLATLPAVVSTILNTAGIKVGLRSWTTAVEPTL